MQPWGIKSLNTSLTVFEKQGPLVSTSCRLEPKGAFQGAFQDIGGTPIIGCYLTQAVSCQNNNLFNLECFPHDPTS